VVDRARAHQVGGGQRATERGEAAAAMAAVAAGAGEPGVGVELARAGGRELPGRGAVQVVGAGGAPRGDVERDDPPVGLHERGAGVGCLPARGIGDDGVGGQVHAPGRRTARRRFGQRAAGAALPGPMLLLVHGHGRVVVDGVEEVVDVDPAVDAVPGADALPATGGRDGEAGPAHPGLGGDAAGRVGGGVEGRVGRVCADGRVPDAGAREGPPAGVTASTARGNPTRNRRGRRWCRLRVPTRSPPPAGPGTSRLSRRVRRGAGAR